MLYPKEENTLRLMINKYNAYQLPVVDNNEKPLFQDIFAATSKFKVSLSLASYIKGIFEKHGWKEEHDLKQCIAIANRIWGTAYPNYPYKVAWHDGCQGFFEIWKDVNSGEFYIECAECSLRFDTPEYLSTDICSTKEYGISSYPTVEELKEIDWYKYIIQS